MTATQTHANNIKVQWKDDPRLLPTEREVLDHWCWEESEKDFKLVKIGSEMDIPCGIDTPYGHLRVDLMLVDGTFEVEVRDINRDAITKYYEDLAESPYHEVPRTYDQFVNDILS